MANYCVDYLNGSTSGNGTAGAPWSKIRDCSGVTWASGDKILIRGSASGTTWTGVSFTYGTTTVKMSGDTRSFIPTGSTLHKTSDNLYYYITAISYATNITTITLNTSPGYYGATEETSVVIGTERSVMGTEDPFTKVGYSYASMVEIIGGYDETFSNIVGRTVLYVTTAWNTTPYNQYYHWKNMVLWSVTNNRPFYHKSVWWTDCAFIGVGYCFPWTNVVTAGSQVNKYTNCTFCQNGGKITNWNSQYYQTYDNCHFYGIGVFDENTNAVTGRIFSGCTFWSMSGTFTTFSGTIFYDCSFGYASGTYLNTPTLSFGGVYNYTLLSSFNDTQQFLSGGILKVNWYNKNSTTKTVRISNTNNPLNQFSDINEITFTGSATYGNYLSGNKLLTGNGYLYTLSGSSYTGSTCIKSENNGGQSTPLYNLFKLPVTGGTSYTFSYFIKGENANANGVNTTITNNGTFLYNNSGATVTTSYTEKTFSIPSTVTSGYIYVTLTLTATNNTNNFYIDYVRLIQT